MKRCIKSAIVDPMDESSDTKQAMAMDPSTSSRILDSLSYDDDNWILLAEVAKNPNTSDATLLRLLNSPYLDVRRAVGQNPNLSEDVIAACLQTNDTDVIFGLTQNPNTPADILEYIAKNWQSLCWGLVEHPNTNNETLHYIATHPNTDCSWQARELLEKRGEQV